MCQATLWGSYSIVSPRLIKAISGNPCAPKILALIQPLPQWGFLGIPSGPVPPASFLLNSFPVSQKLQICAGPVLWNLCISEYESWGWEKTRYQLGLCHEVTQKGWPKRAAKNSPAQLAQILHEVSSSRIKGI